MKIIHPESAPNLDNYVSSARTARPQASAFAEFTFRRFSAECSQFLAKFKDRVAAELANEFSSLDARLVRQVVNEADSLAATTPFPALLLPVLAEEKVRKASVWAARQRAIRDQTLVLAA